MAEKRITDVDFIGSLNSDESFFINQNSTIKQIKRSNVIFNINNGGTGATTVAGARNNLGLGNTSGALPVANGGTGATNAADARDNLGITPKNIGAVTMMTASVELLPNEAWIDNEQIVDVNNVTDNNVVIVNPDSSVENYNTYNECAVRCVAQSTGKLTFVCDYTPRTSIIVNILILV